MKHKFQYETQEERQQLIDNHTDLRLIEEHNVIDGNFLVFTDEPIQEPTSAPQPTILMTAAEYNALIGYKP